MLKIDHIRMMLGMERIGGLWKEINGRDWNDDDVKSVYQIMEKRHWEFSPGLQM